MENQKLLSNKALMIKNFEEVIDNLKECDAYIQEVLDGKRKGDSRLGRMMDDCLGQFSTGDMEMLESMIVSNFEDALMISNLSKLQQYQLRIQEKLNQIFAESITTQPTFNKLRKQNQDAK
jgi:predicted transcriptional regulator